MNFHDMDWLLEKDREHGLKRIEPDDMLRAAANPDAEEEVMQQQCQIHGFETWTAKKNKNLQTSGDGGDLEALPVHFDVRVRHNGESA